MNLLNFFLDLLYPKRCVSCGKFGKYICGPCASMIQFIDANICPICRKPAIGGRTHPKCQTRYSLDGLTSFFKYKDPIREAIKRIKYKPFAFDISKRLISLALEKTDQRNFLSQIIKKRPVLIPVPLHPSRERQRGFNQAQVLGKILAEEWDLNFLPNLLIRSKKTQPQYKLEGKERRENVRKAFQVNQKYSRLFVRHVGKDFKIESGSARQNLHQFARGFKGPLRSILLIDDVWTTGATMRTCGNFLKRAGAKFVWGLTIAR